MSYDMVIKGLCDVGNFDLSIDLVGQMLTYGVGVASGLREFLNEAFAKAGRGEEIERILRGPGSGGYWRPSGSTGPPQRPSEPTGPPQMPGGYLRPSGPTGPPQRPSEPTGPPQMPSEPWDPLKCQDLYR